jgi:Uma2 family endonuclease
MTVSEYLAFEETSEDRHDYVDGIVIDVRAMAGNLFEHNLIESNWSSELISRLRGHACRVFGSNLRVRSNRRATHRYPDLTIACPPFKFASQPRARRSLLNPVMIFEIFSTSTSSVDRGDKFREYFSIPSVKAYVMTSHVEPCIEMWTREAEDLFRVTTARGLDSSIRLVGLDLPIDIRLADIYAGVDLPESGSSDASDA